MTARKCGMFEHLPRRRSGDRPARKSLFLLLPLLAALACAVFAPRRAKGGQNSEFRQRDIPSARSPVSVAVADFDGDHHPDFASVQATQGTISGGAYVVRFRLSQSGRRYVRVSGPGGGLSIQARDVNGDRAVDLVVATAWRNQPVAILLNDGHGNFSPADPSRFPLAFTTSSKDWNGSAAHDMYAVALPREFAGDSALARRVEQSNRKSERLLFSDSAPSLHREIVRHAGRAPPAANLL